MRRLLPVPADDVDDALLAEHYAYPDAGAVRANMVASLDGAATLDGVSGGLSGPADRQVFRLLRALCDVVLVGAGTVRAEDYRPPPTHPSLAWLREGRAAAPTLAVLTRTASLDPGARLFADPDRRPLVVTCAAAPDERTAALAEVAEVVVTGDDDVDLHETLAVLAERGLHRVLTEGGPTLLGALTAADRLDELTLTVSPLVVGGGTGRIVVGSPAAARGFRLRGLLAADQFLFTHYVRERP